MTRVGESAGLLGLLETHRNQLRRYLLAHGAGEAADDLMQELRLRLLAGANGPVQAPVSYLYRAATNLMIDYRRSKVQGEARDRLWSEVVDRSSDSVDPEPSAERQIDARRRAEVVARRLGELPERARRILLRHRVDGVSQRVIAAEYGISQSTVESDLRLAYRFLDQLRQELDEEFRR